MWCLPADDILDENHCNPYVHYHHPLQGTFPPHHKDYNMDRALYHHLQKKKNIFPSLSE